MYPKHKVITGSRSQPPPAYSPISDAMTLRRLLLRALHPDIQLHFHAVEASRTPDEWIQREAALHYNIAAWPFPGESPGHFRMYCPACRAAMPRPSNHPSAHSQEDDPVFRHIAGIAGQDPCPVIAEVLHMLNTVVRPGKFSDEAIEAARRAFELSKLKKTKHLGA
jgi:hypothetical protein